jgi:hypothetical protein
VKDGTENAGGHEKGLLCDFYKPFSLMIIMKKENPLRKPSEESWIEGWQLATFKDGFFLGVFFALILQLGIINITTSLQRFIVFVLLLAGIITTLNQAFRRKALISPSWDGFIAGFGWLIGIIDLLYPNLSILSR